jgi:hypothetical protein
MRTRGQGLLGVSAVAAVATVASVGLSGLVSLRLSASGLPGVAASADRALIGLKERQMEQLDGDLLKASRNVRPSLAEQVTVK